MKEEGTWRNQHMWGLGSRGSNSYYFFFLNFTSESTEDEHDHTDNGTHAMFGNRWTFKKCFC